MGWSIGLLVYLVFIVHTYAWEYAYRFSGVLKHLLMSYGAITANVCRSGIWENCRAAYEDIVKHLER